MSCSPSPLLAMSGIDSKDGHNLWRVWAKPGNNLRKEKRAVLLDNRERTKKWDCGILVKHQTSVSQALTDQKARGPYECLTTASTGIRMYLQNICLGAGSIIFF